MAFTRGGGKVLGTSQGTASVPSVTGTGSNNLVENPYAGVRTANSIYQSVGTINSPFGSPPKISGVVNMIYVKAAAADLVTPPQGQIEQVLHRRHHIQQGQDDDFTVRSLNELAQASEASSRVMTPLLPAVASVSLLVGGVGMLNYLPDA